MKPYLYKIKIRVPLRKLTEEIGEMEDSLNASMEGFGEDKKLFITSLLPLEMSSSKALTKAEIKTCSKIIEEEYTKSLGFSKVVEFKRFWGI